MATSQPISETEKKRQEARKLFSAKPSSLRKSGEDTKYTTIEYPSNTLGGDRYPHFTVFYINDHAAVSENNKTVEGWNSAATKANTANISVSSASKDILQKVKLAEFASYPKRINTAIVLPMPMKVTANYNADYEITEGIGGVGATLASLLGDASGKDAALTAMLSGAPVAAEVGSHLISGLAAKIFKGSAKTVEALRSSVMPSQDMMRQMAAKISGKVLNKRQEQLFNNMGFRQHRISYLFIPRNQEESDNVNRIIKLFKEHMHPELYAGAGSSLLVVPSEFDIEFRTRDSENNSIHKVATSVLVSCDVDYTAIGEFVTFAGTSNPVAISLDLMFRELEPLNRTMIREGNY